MLKTPCKPTRKKTLWRKLSQQRAKGNVESARALSESASDRIMAGANFVFPCYVYSQILKSVR